MSVMQFDELVPGSTVRFAVIDKVQYLSIRDLIMIVCDKSGNYALEVWRRLPEDKKNEVHAFCVNFKFPGRGQQKQPLITFPGALKLMMWLPGSQAKAFRTKVTEIITRYFAGDKSLLHDIQANAESSSPINEAARASLESDQSKQALDQEEQEYSQLKRKRAEEVAYLRESNPLFKHRIRAQNEYMAMSQQWHASYMQMENEKLELQRKKIEMERANLEVITACCNQDLEYKRGLVECTRKEIENKRALKNLESEPPQINPDTTTTVLKVYQANKEMFPLLKPDQRRGFLSKAGTYAASSYLINFGVHPSKVEEHGMNVNLFPVMANNLVMQALKGAYREAVSGGSQRTLDAAFARL